MKPAQNKKNIKKGFAAMDPRRVREIAAKGGKISHGGGRPPSHLARSSLT